MTELTHINKGATVYLTRAAATSVDGTPDTAVIGTVLGFGRAEYDGKDQDVVLVQRHDGKIGGGPDGAWVAPVGGVEQERLFLDQVVRVDGGQGLFQITGCYAGGYYALESSVGVTMERVDRARLELVRSPEGHNYGVEWDRETSRAAENPPSQPPKVAEMQNWNFDMRVPLNHGARFPTNLPNDSDERKKYPLGQVLFGQFGAAMIDLARHSWEGNNKHNPDQALQDARDKSNDDLDCALRHLAEGDYRGAHWRVARLHQKQLEAEGAPVAPLATFGNR